MRTLRPVRLLAAVVVVVGLVPAPGLAATAPPAAGEAAEEAAAAGAVDAPAWQEAAVPTESGLSLAGGSGDVVTIYGAGFGHGIGMSQYGAYARARDGQSAADILAAYYPGTTLGPDPTTETLWVNLESELEKVEIGVLALGEAPATATVRRYDPSGTGTPTEATLEAGEHLVVTYLDLGGPRLDPVDNPRRCAVSVGADDLGDGSCIVDVEWDPATTAVVIERRWWHDTPAAGDACTVWPYTASDPGCALTAGALHIRPDDFFNEPPPGDTGFHVVQELAIEDYLLGIAEMPYSWGNVAPVALEVQAIAARTYARYVDGFRPDPEDAARQWCWCDIYDSSIDEVYLTQGVDAGTVVPRDPRWVAAVAATAGQVVLYDGAVAQAYYASSNGGATENNEDIWGGNPIPYLRSVPDPWSLDPVNPYRAWTRTLPVADFAAKVNLDSVDRVAITARYDSGTPKTVQVTGQRNGSTITRTYSGVVFKNLFTQTAFTEGTGLPSAHVTRVAGPWVTMERWWGQDRYETAAAISRQAFPDGASTVLVATGLDFPDALVAAPLARALGAPLLLVRVDAIPAATRTELERLAPQRIVILGGEGVVGPDVAAALAGYAATVDRLAGPDRYATAAAVAGEAFPNGAPVVYLATGFDFPDALSAAPVASLAGGPLLLTRPYALPAATRRELIRLAPERVVVLGAGTSIDQAVVDEVAGYVPTVETVTGGDGLTVSAATAAAGFPGGAPVVFLATGDVFPDALAAGPAAALLGGPVLLTDPATLRTVTGDELRRLDPARVVVLGGEGAVTAAVADAVADLLR